MAGQTDLVLSNLGFKAYMSEVGETPTAADRLVGIKSMSGYGVSINTLDATELDGNGYARFVASLKTLKPVTLAFNVRDKETYVRLYERVFNTDTSDEGYYADFTFVFPKKQGWGTDAVRDVTITACITDFSLDNVDPDSVQSFTITIQGQDKPVPFTGTISE